jgi:hypothetical protein
MASMSCNLPLRSGVIFHPLRPSISGSSRVFLRRIVPQGVKLFEQLAQLE